MEHPLVSVGNLKILFWVDPPQGGYNFEKKTQKSKLGGRNPFAGPFGQRVVNGLFLELVFIHFKRVKPAARTGAGRRAPSWGRRGRRGPGCTPWRT